VKALAKTARDHASCLRIVEAVEAVNDDQKRRVLGKLLQALDGTVAGARIAVWGLAFKPNTDDLREAPALALIQDLLAAGARVVAHDPVAMTAAAGHFSGCVDLAETNYDALEGADALAVMTDWNEYRHPDFVRIKALLRRPIIVDARNLYALEKMAALGFHYHSIGRPSVHPT
jgi:UDPglucose 6-dehydrogenase